MKFLKLDEDNYIRPAAIMFVKVKEDCHPDSYKVSVCNLAGEPLTVKHFYDDYKANAKKAAREYMKEFVAKLETVTAAGDFPKLDGGFIKINDSKYIKPSAIATVETGYWSAEMIVVTATTFAGEAAWVKKFKVGDNEEETMKKAREYLKKFVAKIEAGTNGHVEDD